MIQTKALYNLLRLNAKADPTLKADPWALEDFRLLAVEAIFSRLAALNVHLDKNAFAHYADECDSPEKLAELLLDQEKDPATFDHAYLLLFELWRRILPERPSLSIFCDELDRRIAGLEEGSLTNDEPIQDGLANLLEVLQEHVDRGMKPKEAFQSISDYCASDLESFLFETIAELLDEGNQLYANELLEEFESYMQDPLPFEFLDARLISMTDIGEANCRIGALLKKKLEPELLFEILQFLVASGEHHLFQVAMKKLLPKLKTEEEFQDAMELAADYYRRLDQDERERAILKLKTKRQNAKDELDPTDPDLGKFEELVFSVESCNSIIDPLAY